jgi:hypothetical protein
MEGKPSSHTCNWLAERANYWKKKNIKLKRVDVPTVFFFRLMQVSELAHTLINSTDPKVNDCVNF